MWKKSSGNTKKSIGRPSRMPEQQETGSLQVYEWTGCTNFLLANKFY